MCLPVRRYHVALVPKAGRLSLGNIDRTERPLPRKRIFPGHAEKPVSAQQVGLELVCGEVQEQDTLDQGYFVFEFCARTRQNGVRGGVVLRSNRTPAFHETIDPNERPSQWLQIEIAKSVLAFYGLLEMFMECSLSHDNL